jgi:HD-GYP domain-containing protein (c-di-GMP phosphodiesterase class II)
MRLVRLDSIRGEMELARDIPSAVPGALPLLRRGVRLSPALAGRLAARGVRAVWVQDGLGDGIIPAQPLPDHVRRSTEQAVATCLRAARSTAGGIAGLPAAALGQIEDAAGGILSALDDCPEAALALDDLASADSYSYSHSVRVATLGLLLGHRINRLDGWIDWRGRRRFDQGADRMIELAMGLLIHDIGKIAIPAAVLNKPAKLTPEEWDLIKTHPSAGASMLSADRVSALTICVVRDHHERWDGRGYERGRTGADTHQFARIAAVADVYDAITADRPYKPATAPHVGVRIVRDGAGSQFDPGVVEHFTRVAMPYPVGHSITMPSRRSAVVARVDAERPEHPSVRYHDEAGRVCEAVMHVVDGVVRAPQWAAHPAPADDISGDTDNGPPQTLDNGPTPPCVTTAMMDVVAGS